MKRLVMIWKWFSFSLCPSYEWASPVIKGVHYSGIFLVIKWSEVCYYIQLFHYFSSGMFLHKDSCMSWGNPKFSNMKEIIDSLLVLQIHLIGPHNTWTSATKSPLPQLALERRSHLISYVLCSVSLELDAHQNKTVEMLLLPFANQERFLAANRLV